MIHNEKKSSLSTYFGAFLVISLAAQTLSAEEISLQARVYADSLLRVKTVVDVAGSLRWHAQGKKPVEIPMQVNAELFFDELGLHGEHSPAIRHYWEAKAELVVNEEKEERKLRDDRQLIVLNNDTELARRYWSPHGMLRRTELDLLDVAGCAFPPELLLPKVDIDKSETWTVDDENAAQLLRLSEVTSGELTNVVKEITDEAIKVELSGEVEGIADGAKTTISVTGNYHFDRSKKMISWFAIAIHEQREIGFGAPGFDVTARIRSARQTIDKSDALTKMIVTQARRDPTAGDLLLEFTSDDDLYRAALDRRWYLVQHQKSSTVLRLIDDRDLLATCKVDRLNRMPAGKQITLSGFQSDVEAALDKNCLEVLSASESVNPQGVRVLRIAARGEVDTTPIRWIYYHLSDDEGQRLSLIFTHESSLASRLGSIDEAMTSSISLVPRGQQAKAEDGNTTR